MKRMARERVILNEKEAIIAEQSGMRKQQTRRTALCATRFMI